MLVHTKAGNELPRAQCQVWHSLYTRVPCHPDHLFDLKLVKLRSLWSRYSHEKDGLQLVAGSLPGGWTSRQVANLLRKHGLRGRVERGIEQSITGND
jgi:hypothetical protein